MSNSGYNKQMSDVKQKELEDDPIDDQTSERKPLDNDAPNVNQRRTEN